MATQVPRSATLEVPTWFWGGDVPGFFVAAGLRVVTTSPSGTELVVEATERGAAGRPNLVTVRDLAGPSVPRADFAVLAELDEQAYRQLGANLPNRDREVTSLLDDLRQRVAGASSVTALSGGFTAHQLQTMNATSADLPHVVRTVWEDIREIHRAEAAVSAFPNASVHFIQRSAALMHRTKLAAVLLRIEHDKRLRSADLESVRAANARGEIVFASSGALGEGIALLDAYLAPLLGAITPFVWAYPATRASGTVLYALGSQITGTDSVAVEPLHLLPSRGATQRVSAPPLTNRSATAAINWWTRRIDRTLSIVSDPAVYTDSGGRYAASKHLHAQLSVDQLFRRVGSIQRSHRDTDVRRVLLFTVLDTLERLTSRGQVEMCTLSFAQRTVERLREDMSTDVAALLLPAADRAVDALRQMQFGFFLARQQNSTEITFSDSDGVEQRLSLETAVAQYIRVLRNATHGHGSNRDDHKLRVDALLAHHDGEIPHDLGLLGWLYLLDLLSNPESLRRTLYDGGHV